MTTVTIYTAQISENTSIECSTLEDALQYAPEEKVKISERELPNTEAAPDYREQRRAEYPDIGDQLDAIMKWAATETEFNIPAELKSIAMSCMSVKSKYPKPSEE